MYVTTIDNTTPQFRLGAISGILTGVGANGDLFSFNLVSGAGDPEVIIQRIKLRWQTLTAFTAAQEILIRVFRETWTSARTGGTQILPANFPRRNPQFASAIGAASDIRIATTGALTPGTTTVETESLGVLSLWSQTAAAPAVLGHEAIIGPDRDVGYLTRLRHAEGIVVRSVIAMGAAGTGRLSMDLEWMEVKK